MIKPLVYIIIPIHNGLIYTKKCLKNIEHLKYNNYKIVIIDNGSIDNSRKYIKDKYPQISILKGNGNLWWTGAISLGVDFSIKNNCDYVCLLNNDNTFENNFLDELVNASLRYKIPMICSKVIDEENNKKIIFAGGKMTIFGSMILLQKFGENEANKEKYVDFAGGMGILIKKDVIECVKFDSINFPHYGGDVDFFLRAKEKGYKFYYQPKSIIYNSKGQTGLLIDGSISNFIKSFIAMNSVMNIKKNIKFYYRHCPIIYFPFVLFNVYSRYILSFLKGFIIGRINNSN